jgi:hypothetical protein
MTKAERTTRGQFKEGTSGNPSGRPTGSRNGATLLAETLLEGEAEELTRKVVNLAKKGNFHALRFCLERVLPIRKERSIEFELPMVHSAQDLSNAFQSVLVAAGKGDITPGEAQCLCEVLNSQARVLEFVDLEGRLQALENNLAQFHECRNDIRILLQGFADENKHEDQAH